ncbi:MAG: hypothetical protein IH948_03785 [Bacteroidetes bacterium]|nr:hypothetical protein [Bacteroidota bacterium]
MQKLKSIHVKYHEKDYDKMEKLKKAKGINWTDFIYWAVINSELRK